MTNQTKTKYRIRNWSQYNRALINRGSLSIWFEDTAPKWREKKRTGKKGRPRLYSDDAILCALILRAVYHLPLRALEGFLQWVFQVMQLTLPVPCYTRICRRAAQIGQELKKLTEKRPTDIVFDSTGVKVYGEGEWKVRQHGKDKKRIWRKVHLAVCPDSHEIVLSELTESRITDACATRRMIKKLPRSVKIAYGDGAFDRAPFYAELQMYGLKAIIPPRRGGRLQDIDKKPWMLDRNNALRAITGLGNDDEARKMWKILSGYHRRSLGETAMFRFKKLFGGSFRSRELKRQKAELYAKSLAMNKMTQLGMPKGEWVTF
ncbi:MAG TPA: IS5 family transposase [Candidatus Babeliaceae bacterium]|nr:IS5 family transposase [Candidatus Babeliaceae bacterium]